MHRILSRLSAVALFVSPVLLCGCTRKWDEGGTTHYAFELWVGLLLLVGSLAAIIGGWAMRIATARFGYGMVFTGAIGLLFIAPGMFLDRVTLSNEGFTLRTGFWMYPTRHDVKFSEVSAIAVTSKVKRGKRGKRTDYNLECTKSEGGMVSVPVGTLMKEVYEDILDKASDRGIAVTVLGDRPKNPEDAPSDITGFDGGVPVNQE
jgi:hypothetical protein